MSKYLYICPICEQLIEVPDTGEIEAYTRVDHDGHLVSHNIEPTQQERMIQLVQENLYEWSITGGDYFED